MRRLVAYSWPGNVRELENVVERAVILSAGPMLNVDPDILRLPVAEVSADTSGSLVQVERDHILAALRKTGWVIEGPRGAAAALGLHPNTLRSRLKKLGISRPPHESS